MSANNLSEESPVQQAINKIRLLIRGMKECFEGNDRAIELLAACTIAGKPLLLLGEPGTAKTTMSVQFYRRMGLKRGAPGDIFEKCFHPYIEPSEIYGPIDHARLTGNPSEYVRRTEGFLPKARVAILDDLFAASPDFLLTLLAILENRVYHNGANVEMSPLHMIVATANDLPHQARLRALVNRLPIRVLMDDMKGIPKRISVLKKSAELWMRQSQSEEEPSCSFGDVDVCAKAISLKAGDTQTFDDDPVVKKYVSCLDAISNHAAQIANPNARTQQKVYEVMRALALLRRSNPHPEFAEIRILEHVFDVPEGRQNLHDELEKHAIPEWKTID